MAKIKIVWEDDNSCDVSLVNLSGKADPPMIVNDEGDIRELETKGDGTPIVIRRHEDGEACEYARSLPSGEVVNGVISMGYQHPNGEVFKDAQLNKFYVTVDGEEIAFEPKDKTDIFEIASYEPMDSYMDKYQIVKYYQVMPSDGAVSKSKKSKMDMRKQLTIDVNTAGMLKLWKHLHDNNLLGKGQLNITSTGRLPSYGYLRAVVLPDNEWTLEIALFKQRKEFIWKEKMEFKAQPMKKKVTSNIVEI